MPWVLALVALAFAPHGAPPVDWVCTASIPPSCRQIPIAAASITSRGPADWTPAPYATRVPS